MTEAEVKLECLRLAGGTLSFAERLYAWVTEKGPIVEAYTRGSFRPGTSYVSFGEGEDWHPWFPFDTIARSGANLVHAIKFSDGSIWDTHNGWRKTT